MDSKRKHCPHCDEELVAKVFKRHRRQFFNEMSNTWTTVGDIKQEEDESLDVGDILCDITDYGDHNISDCNIFESCMEKNSERPIQEESINAFLETLEDEDQAYFCEPSEEEERDSLSNQSNFEIWDTVKDNELNEDFVEQLDSSNLFTAVLEEESHDPRLLTLANWFCLFLSYLWYFHNLTETCMLLILGFFRMMFCFLGQIFPCMADFSVLLPESLYKLKKRMGLNEDKFTKFVVCQKCSSIYKFDDCYKKVGSQNIPVKCKFQEFPAHKQKKFRQACGAPLLKEVEIQLKKRLYPFKVYCYKSVLQSLSDLVKRDGFVEKCELWRNRRPSPGVLSDVYDGRIWKEFQSVEGQPFLSVPKNYAMQLNLDWFCPFKHLPQVLEHYI
ncbi:uncharacterized protein [Ptychodera flava]|uniref:uncharacterized protein n=1 Tax=Ptychodera flava TaxID=63121 RepID=UPI00396A2916